MEDLAVNPADVIPTISPNDEMLRGGGGEGWYHEVGQSALECIGRALNSAGKPAADVKRILDLPCGHGRVLRYLRAAFPEAEFVACDIARDAADFCAATFGAVPVYAHEDSAKIPLEPNSFDLIWVGSLLTHFDQLRWKEYLNFFRGCLRPGGVLVFSTHGRAVYQRMARGIQPYLDYWWGVHMILYEYERTGFGYADYTGTPGYGISLCSPAWVCAELFHLGELRLVFGSEGGWATFQDVFACVRDPNAQALRPTISTFTYVKRRIRALFRRLPVRANAVS